jgi:CRP/FNR family transcriptional regulator, cyclic AMP receptor protein
MHPVMIDIDLLLAWGAAFKKVSAGETIFSEGMPCCFYYQLVSGSVRWVNIDDNGKEFIQTIIEPGECFGELPLFDDGPYAASAIADDDSVVIRLHKPVFTELLKENQALHFAFSRLLAQRVRFKFLLLKSLAVDDPENRISTLLNHLKKENRNFCGKCNKLNLTRQQIADMTGLRVETVIRAMRTMHEKGELLIDKGKVYCRDMITVI